MRLGQNPASSGTGCGEAWSEADEARWIAEMRLPPADVVEPDDGARHGDLGLGFDQPAQLVA
jgi:hypothetical protein